jgi:hypothetical protein
MRNGSICIYHVPGKQIISSINDGHGIAIACFCQPYRIGAIAEVRVLDESTTNEYRQTSRFKILRKVGIREVRLLAKKANDGRALNHGWWYEVIGD